MCEGGTNQVKAASAVFFGANYIPGTWRQVNVTCAGTATCLKSGSSRDGCASGSIGDAGTALNSNLISGAVAGATLQVGGRCEVVCNTANVSVAGDGCAREHATT